jgi:RNA 3'-phosphate cyclase
MLEINGSTLEGGGQILRTATAISVISKNPCRIFNIRKGRKKPGLMHQHLLGVQALSLFCNGKLEGDNLNSEEIKFYPGSTYREDISINIPTAGSITLALQPLIIAAIFSHLPLNISFKGGATDTFFSPTFDYFQYVFLKILEKIGVKTKVNILKRGYYPEGGAEIKIKILDSKIQPIKLTKRGSLKKIMVVSGASEFLKEKRVAERQVAGVREILGKLKLPTEEKIEYYQTDCSGSQIALMAEFENMLLGTDNLGKLGKRAEDIGKEAALQLLKEEKTGACLDKHMADQILPYMAFSPKKSEILVSEITNHCKTNIWVIEKFLKGKFKIDNNTITWNPKD